MEVIPGIGVWQVQKGRVESSWFKDKAVARGIGTPGLVATSTLVALACSVGHVLVKAVRARWLCV